MLRCSPTKPGGLGPPAFPEPVLDGPLFQPSLASYYHKVVVKGSKSGVFLVLLPARILPRLAQKSIVSEVLDPIPVPADFSSSRSRPYLVGLLDFSLVANVSLAERFEPFYEIRISQANFPSLCSLLFTRAAAPSPPHLICRRTSPLQSLLAGALTALLQLLCIPFLPCAPISSRVSSP